MRRDRQTITVSPTLRRLLVELETNCTADCCKGKAFDITPKAIKSWLMRERIDRTEDIANEIAKVESTLSRKGRWIFLDNRHLESEWESETFRIFWQRFAEQFAGAVADYRKERAQLL